MKTLKNCINEIISNKDNFASGDFFDSHTVINELMINKEYFFAYLNEYPKGTPINEWHSTIAKMIGESNLVEKMDFKIKRQTVFDKISENQVWKKL